MPFRRFNCYSGAAAGFILAETPGYRPGELPLDCALVLEAGMKVTRVVAPVVTWLLRKTDPGVADAFGLVMDDMSKKVDALWRPAPGARVTTTTISTRAATPEEEAQFGVGEIEEHHTTITNGTPWPVGFTPRAATPEEAAAIMGALARDGYIDEKGTTPEEAAAESNRFNHEETFVVRLAQQKKALYAALDALKASLDQKDVARMNKAADKSARTGEYTTKTEFAGGGVVYNFDYDKRAEDAAEKEAVTLSDGQRELARVDAAFGGELQRLASQFKAEKAS